MGLADADLLASIDAVYDTVLDPGRWRDALDGASQLAGAHGSILFSRDPGQRELEIAVMSSSFDERAGTVYLDTLLSEDELRWDDCLEQVPALTLLDDTEIWPDREQFRAMPSTRWLRDRHFHHRSAARLCAHGGWKDTLTPIYVRGRGPTSASERERLGLLLPHMARALEIRRPFQLLRCRYQAVLGVLDRLGLGVLVLADDDHILIANDEACRILEAGDGLRRRADGRLGVVASLSRSDEYQELLQAIGDARAGREPQGRTLYLPRSSGSLSYVADVATFREAGVELESPFVGALLCLIDPTRRDAVSITALARVYGLSEAEAAVCSLICEGLDSGAIAESRRVSVDTVKTQSKAILRKTACRNRVELVRRALTIAPPLL